MPCGLIIEKVNGIPVEKRLCKDETFADVRYLLEMCRQVSHCNEHFPTNKPAICAFCPTYVSSVACHARSYSHQLVQRIDAHGF